MLIYYEDPMKFLQHVGRFLEEREAENNLILGISLSLATNPERIKYPAYFAVVEEKGTIGAAAMMTPPHRIVLSRAEKEPLRAIVTDLAKRRMIIPGVNGPSETSQAFANLWVEKTGGTYTPHRSMRIYQLSHVIPPAPIEGQMREASEKDKDALLQWVNVSLPKLENRKIAKTSSKRFREDLLTGECIFGRTRDCAPWQQGVRRLVMVFALT